MSEQLMAYGARREGEPGFCEVVADIPTLRKETAKVVAKWIREGLTVEHVDAKVAGEKFVEHIDWLELNKAKPQGALL